mmetsp:Transcript_15008/g.24698  ORF Transcript_15008/g.24698 Transcript_15008/m.24698 type:complete len:136 (-) Transcript_15008:571-978(-)
MLGNLLCGLDLLYIEDLFAFIQKHTSNATSGHIFTEERQHPLLDTMPPVSKKQINSLAVLFMLFAIFLSATAFGNPYLLKTSAREIELRSSKPLTFSSISADTSNGSFDMITNVMSRIDGCNGPAKQHGWTTLQR